MKKINRILLVIFGLAGAAIMTYLTYLHFSGVEGSFCNLGEGFSCDVVNKSIYSEVLGIPVAVLGLLYFLAVLAVAIFRYDKATLKLVTFFSIAFLGPSLYLTGTEIFILENICVFCELSKVLILAIVIVAWNALGIKTFKGNHFVWAVILAILLGGATYLVHNSGGPGDKYVSFAQCLDEKGFIMYGSEGCAFCARQRKLIGDGFEFIEEIECDPRYEENQVELCIEKDISKTPTWIQEDEEGNELYRFDPGVQSLQTLSEVSECSLTENDS